LIWAGHSRSRWAGASLLFACAVAGQGLAQTPVQATTVEAATPEAIAYDSAGNMYVALRNAHVVRRIDTLGFITTVAGTGQQGFGGDGAAATSALLDSPDGLAVDANGVIYLADTRNHRVRMVANGVITTIAGTGVAGFSGDSGNAAAAQLDLPTALSIDAAGNLYIADTNNQRIRKVSAGVITTVAGSGLQGFGGDGQPAVAAQLDSPAGVAVDPSNPGRFYISDTHNQRVRMVDGNGVITTVAGTGSLGFGGEGATPTTALLALPRGLSVTTSGVYLADSNNQRIRLIVSGAINTVAGDGEQGFAGDLGAATAAVLDTPRAVSVSTGGLFAIADTHNQRVRTVNASVINTNAGVPQANTEGLLLSGPVSQTFGTSGGKLTALLSSPTGTATGSLVLNVAGRAATSAPIANNSASFDLGFLSGGLQSLTVSYAGNSSTAPIVSGVYLLNVSAAAQTITFPTLQSPVTYSPGLTAALAATASSGLPVTYTVTGPATVSGSTLTYTGAGSVTVTATQAGNANYNAASSNQTVSVTAATQTITFTPLQTPVTYSPGLTGALTATASSGLPVTFTATGPATVSGSTLTYTGSGTVVVTATQAGNANYTAVSASQTVSVSPSPLVISSVTPNTVVLGGTGQLITVTGSGFTATSVIRFNGVAATSVVDSTTQIHATLPQQLTPGSVPVTVFDPATQFSSAAIPITVSPAKATATLTVPATSTSGQQPMVGLALQTAYPVPINGVYTLMFTPSGTPPVDDPAIQFPNGMRSYPFTIAANATAGPSVPFQTGTIAGTVTVSFTLNAAGVDVTPTTGQTAVVVIPGQAPTASSVSFVQSGPTVTATVTGFSNVRNVASATFNFTPAPGTSLAVTSLTLPVTTIFNNWFSSAASDAFGSTFTYTQIFNLSDAGAKVQSISVTLTNSVGTSVSASTP
jgi:hypothetical protein